MTSLNNQKDETIVEEQPKLSSKKTFIQEKITINMKKRDSVRSPILNVAPLKQITPMHGMSKIDNEC